MRFIGNLTEKRAVKTIVKKTEEYFSSAFRAHPANQILKPSKQQQIPAIRLNIFLLSPLSNAPQSRALRTALR